MSKPSGGDQVMTPYEWAVDAVSRCFASTTCVRGGNRACRSNGPLLHHHCHGPHVAMHSQLLLFQLTGTSFKVGGDVVQFHLGFLELHPQSPGLAFPFGFASIQVGLTFTEIFGPFGQAFDQVGRVQGQPLVRIVRGLAIGINELDERDRILSLGERGLHERGLHKLGLLVLAS